MGGTEGGLQAIQLLLAEHPKAATEKDSGGWLPLHLVARFMSGAKSHQAVMLLLSVHPQAAREKTTSGHLTLHIVAQFMGGVGGLRAVQLLLAEYPQAVKEKGEDGWLPLHFVARYMGGVEGLQTFQLLLTRYPEAAKEKTAAGDLPLHIVARYMGGAEGLRATQLLLAEYPEAAREKNSNGWLPLHIVAQYMGGAEGLQAFQLLLARYTKAAKSPTTITGHLPLHLAARYMGGATGLQAIQLLLAAYPQAAKKKTLGGYLPIGLMCLNVNGATSDMVHALLSAYRGGITVKNSYGHMPYTIADQNNLFPADAIDLLRRAQQRLADSEWALDRSDIFQPIVVLFEGWAACHAPLSGAADIIRIASAVEQLIRVLIDASSDAQRLTLAYLDDMEYATPRAESAVHHFRELHGMLADVASLSPEPHQVGLIISKLVTARDVRFTEVCQALQTAEECCAYLDLDTAALRLKFVESAVAALAQATGVKLDTALQVDAVADESADTEAIRRCAAAFRRTALGITRRVQESASSAEQLVKQSLTQDKDKVLQAASDVREDICDVITFDGTTESDSLAALLKDAVPWDAILRCTAQLRASRQVVNDKVGCLQRRTAALRSEVDAFAAAFAAREHVTSILVENHKALKRAQLSYRRLKVEFDANSDSDSDAEGPDLEELSRHRSACLSAIRDRDAAARKLFLAARAYHPETLVNQRKYLRRTSLSTIWSERRLEAYDERQALFRRQDSRHALVRAKYEGRFCILKLFQLQQGEALCKEAEILHRLSHPNIVKLEAAFVESDFLYLHFPFAKHGDLEQYLEVQTGMSADARISVACLRRMARQLCEALAYLAERSIVHCDVKPANVFVDEERNQSGAPCAILGDFDVSHTSSGRTATLTMPLQTRDIATHYSAGYAAPEVVRARSGHPPRATSKLDVYGLGCVIFRMHMYPRALPEPESVADEVAKRSGLFDLVSSGTLPDCAVPAWAAAVPLDVVADATRANPIARLSARELLKTEHMRNADGEFARVAVQRPAHWQYQEHAGSWLVRENTEVEAEVEKLLNETAVPETHGAGPNGHGVQFDRFKVVRVQRVENSQVWSAYAARRRALADTLASKRNPLAQKDDTAQSLAIHAFSYPLEGGTLENAAGEAFLFHGTRFPESIASSGFDVRYAYAGAGAGAAFGRGVYFAESASKADQYVSRKVGDKLTLVLARVCLGRCKVVGEERHNAPFLPEVPELSTPSVPVHYDSILTTMPSMHFREVVVGRDTSAYPELLVEYERV